MNWAELMKNKGALVKLSPPACHLSEFGEPLLPTPDEDWTIVSFQEFTVLLSAPSGYSIQLHKDHICNWVSGSQNFLRLMVQVFIEGDDNWVRPNSKPGAPVEPSINHALKARAIAVPELERAFRRQIEILDRVAINFGEFVFGHIPRTGDTWESLKPHKSALRSPLPIPAELTAKDSELLAEFYASVREVDDLLEHWITTREPESNYNIWNVLMHKVQHSLRVGVKIVREFCPARSYAATSPASGTLISRADRVLASADEARNRALSKKDLPETLARLGALPTSPPPKVRS
jgi:hypothetical protein